MFDLQRSTHLEVAARTDTGQRRSENQDSFLVVDLTAHPSGGGVMLHPETPPTGGLNAFTVGPKGALLLVADGMGGAAAGALASKLAVAWIYRALIAGWGPDRNNTPRQFAVWLREALVQANTRIHEEAQRDARFHGMGTTATAVGILDGFMYLAHVGDSRAYLVRNGMAMQLTRDQSLVQALVEAGTYSSLEEAEQSGHGNMILQALGTEAQVRVDMTYQELRRGDMVLVCSDGLFRVVRPEEIVEAEARFAQDLSGLCDSLIALANARGGPDNITVVAVRARGEGLEHPTQDDAVERREYILPDL